MRTRSVWCQRFSVVAGLCLAAAIGVTVPAAAAPEPEPELTIASDGVTIGSDEIPAPNAPGSCQIAVFINVPVPPDCTLFSSSFQAPAGSHVIRQASVRTGPSTGPMRFVVLRAYRSQAGIPAGIICCIATVESQIFTPTPNSINTIPVSLPILNSVTTIDGEPVEVVDYLAISILDRNSTLPLVATTQGFNLTSVFLPSVAAGQERILSSAASLPIGGGSAVPTISAVACSTDGDSTEAVCQTVGTPGTSFTGVVPSRRLDTRSSGRVAAGSTTSVEVGGVGGVPADATAAVLNVTAVRPSEVGFLTVFPCGETQPDASSVNFRSSQTVANAVIATLGQGGEVCVFSSEETDLLVDVNGAITDGFAGLNPDRLLDTRATGRVGAGSTTRVRIAGVEGVPAGAIAAVLNITAVAPLDKGFLTVFPCDETQPDSSNVNFEAQRTVPNAVVATLGSGGDVCIFSSVSTNLLVDLNGAVSEGFGGLVPDRLLDTRASGRVAAGSTSRVPIAGAPGVAAGAVAAVLNVTAVSPSDGGFLTVFPCGETPPDSSNLNFGPGETIANAAVATLGTGGEVCVFSSVETNLLVDLNGTFA